MKNVEEFINSSVKIEQRKDGYFGHHPFLLFSEDKQGENVVGPLSIIYMFLTGRFSEFARHIKNGDKRIYMSLDMKPYGDIKNNFVAIFSFEDNKINVFALPYNVKNGERLEIIKSGQTITYMKNEFINMIEEAQSNLK